ncbi:MAG: hypothetical protein D6679_13760 [Candidatus Hydrogenedentota bacterium]|nr:MAG: hypothetical protein D6679_13760 [Candidatus Hydrogenedentota bacterium]
MSLKDILFILAVVALGVFGWMKVAVDYLPQKEARKFVEEVRLGVDNGILGSNFHYYPPLADDVFEMPKEGIAPNYQMKRINEVHLFDKPDSRTQKFSVVFSPSPQARTHRKKLYEYVLVMEDHGTLLLPKYKATMFLNKDSRKWKRRRKHR